MTSQNFLAFHPERIPWIGFGILCGAFVLGLPFLFFTPYSKTSFSSYEAKKKEIPRSCAFSLNLEEKIPFLTLPGLENEMNFSFDPPRPEGIAQNQQLLVHLNKSGESKRTQLPARVDLRFQNGKLSFSPQASSFWIELSSAQSGQIQGKVFLESETKDTVDAGNFFVFPQESPFRAASEFAADSPFRLLAEARWWGPDLIREQFERSFLNERLEIGSSLWLEVKEGDFLVWKEESWSPLSAVSEGTGKPIARVQSKTSKNLWLEGWGTEGYVRLNLFPAAPAAAKVRGEDLFSSIRIRSEKQISCMMEKQCLILKTGDWVVKTKDSRWKVLRKKAERDSFLKGDLTGDLFLFDQIQQKQGQKVIQGRLFNASRSQSSFIEVAAQTSRKAALGKEISSEKSIKRGNIR